MNSFRGAAFEDSRLLVTRDKLVITYSIWSSSCRHCFMLAARIRTSPLLERVFLVEFSIARSLHLNGLIQAFQLGNALFSEIADLNGLEARPQLSV